MMGYNDFLGFRVALKPGCAQRLLRERVQNVEAQPDLENLIKRSQTRRRTSVQCWGDELLPSSKG